VEVGNAKLRLCVTDFIQGNNFLALGQSPKLNEIKTIARQAAIINSMRIKPTYLNDSWCVLSFLEAYKERRTYLTPEDDEQISHIVEDAKRIKFKSLPHTFVHGDIISTNVIKGGKGTLWIVDFSCANYYPRIIEFAVLTADLLLGKEKSESDKHLDIALREYQKTLPLTKVELETLPVVSKMAHAMHVINTLYYKVIHRHNTKESDYFLDKGREGLRQTFEKD
jgi:Ser/Thr protein kinase RdoA (MazF antagonist)